MEQENFERSLRELKKPNPVPAAAANQALLTILSSRTAARWGLGLIIFPLFFFSCVAIKYFFGWHWGFGGTIIEWMASVDKSSGTGWVTPVVFVILPALGVFANLATIMGFSYDRLRNELLVSIRLRWLNILLAIICLLIIGMVILYGILENAHRTQIPAIGV